MIKIIKNEINIKNTNNNKSINNKNNKKNDSFKEIINNNNSDNTNSVKVKEECEKKENKGKINKFKKVFCCL